VFGSRLATATQRIVLGAFPHVPPHSLKSSTDSLGSTSQ
jgi:hypothetical protein